MSVLSILLGMAVVFTTMADFLLTTISIRREGPLTRLASDRIGRLLDRSEEDGPISDLRGPVLLSLLAALWIGGLWLGWVLVVWPGHGALSGPEGSAVGIADVAGFVGSTLSTMGLGVVTPRDPAWHIVAVLISVTGMVVLTLTVSYIFNVTTVATSSRALARHLDMLRDRAGSGDRPDARSLILRAADTLIDRASLLADQRRSYPLAVHYDREGSRRDVRRAVRAFAPLLAPDRLRPASTVEAATASMLREVLQEVDHAR